MMAGFAPLAPVGWLAAVVAVGPVLADPPPAGVPEPPTPGSTAPDGPTPAKGRPGASEAEAATADPGRARAEGDRALRARGLRRDGLVYVLKKEDDVRDLITGLQLAAREADDARAQMALRETSAAQAQAVMNGLIRQREDLDAANAAAGAMAAGVVLDRPTAGTGAATTKPTADQVRADLAAGLAARNAQMLALQAQFSQVQAGLLRMQVDYNQIGTFVMARQNDVRRGRAELDRLVEEVRREYAALAADPAVKSALAALNKGSDVRYALGPRADYRANLQRMAAELLQAKGFQPGRRGGWVLGAVADIATASYWVETFQRELAADLARRIALRREWDFRDRRLADLEARASRSGPPGADAEVARLRQEQADAAKSLRALALDVAAKRERFVQSVRTLRMAVEDGRKKQGEVADDTDVRRALADLKTKHARPLRTPLGSRKAEAAVPPLLHEAEKAIRVEEVPLAPDRAAPAVVAAVNDVAGLKLVVDPAAESVQVSARFAASVRLDTNPSSAPVTVKTRDGQTLHARRATLRSVRVGGFLVRDVPCLVLLDGYDGPPVLGAAFFDHYLARLDPDAGTLTLTEVTVKPHAPRTTPARSKDRTKGGAAKGAG